jgi:hypothetical protein
MNEGVVLRRAVLSLLATAALGGSAVVARAQSYAVPTPDCR